MSERLRRSALFGGLAAGLVLAGGPVLAQEPAAARHPPVKVPDASAVEDTWRYFYEGQGQGPVLVVAKLCTEIPREGPRRFECTQEVDLAAGVKANTPVHLWQAYLVPSGDTVDDIIVQVRLGDVVRETKDVKLKGDGWRARQWTAVRLNRPGSWTVTVQRGDKVLKELKVKVL